MSIGRWSRRAVGLGRIVVIRGGVSRWKSWFSIAFPGRKRKIEKQAGVILIDWAGDFVYDHKYNRYPTTPTSHTP